MSVWRDHLYNNGPGHAPPINLRDCRQDEFKQRRRSVCSAALIDAYYYFLQAIETLLRCTA